MTALPRGICPVCGRSVALRKAELVREHTRKISQRQPGWARPYMVNVFCNGSGRTARMVLP